MKLTTIYKQKVKDISNDIIKSILNYLVSENTKTISLEDENDTFILSAEKSSIITSDSQEYSLDEFSIDSLLYILDKLETKDYEKII